MNDTERLTYEQWRALELQYEPPHDAAIAAAQSVLGAFLEACAEGNEDPDAFRRFVRRWPDSQPLRKRFAGYNVQAWYRIEGLPPEVAMQARVIVDLPYDKGARTIPRAAIVAAVCRDDAGKLAPNPEGEWRLEGWHWPPQEAPEA